MAAIPKSRIIGDNVKKNTIKDEQIEENKNILGELLSPTSDEVIDNDKNDDKPIKSRNVGSE